MAHFYEMRQDGDPRQPTITLTYRPSMMTERELRELITIIRITVEGKEGVMAEARAHHRSREWTY